MKPIIYETYGHGHDVKRCNIETNLTSNFNCKPVRAWWGSRINSSYGWKEWCEGNYYNYNFEESSLKWLFKPNTKVIYVTTRKTVKWMEEQGFIYKDNYSGYNINFKKVLESGYKAIELMDPNIGHNLYDFTNSCQCFNTWDCQSIVVLDPNVMVLENETEYYKILKGFKRKKSS